MKKALIVASIVVGVAVGPPLVLGSFVPREHVASTSMELAQTPQVVWNAITDVDGMLTWRTGLEAVELLPERDGNAVFVETSRFGQLTFEVVQFQEPEVYEARIVGDDLSFGGSWTWTLEPTDEGCRVTITEDGFIDNAFFRFFARYIAGYHGTQKIYLGDLARKFREEPVLEQYPAMERDAERDA